MTLLALVLGTATALPACGKTKAKSKRSSESEDESPKKGREKEKGESKKADVKQLTSAQITEACTKAIKSSFRPGDRNQKHCEEELKEAATNPRTAEWGVADYDCIMSSAEFQAYFKCESARKPPPPPKEGAKMVLEPVYKEGGELVSCSAFATRPDFASQDLKRSSRDSTSCYFDKSSQKMKVKVKGIKAGSIGRKKLALDGSEAEIELDRAELVAAIEFGDPARWGDTPLVVPLALTNADGDWTGGLRFGTDLLTKLIEKRGSNGILFPGEDASGPVGSTHIVIGRYSIKSPFHVVGTGKKLTDVGKIAFIEEKTRIIGRCSYVGSSRRVESTTLDAKDAQVTLFERKSGKLVETKLFKPQGTLSCQSTTTKSDMNKGTVLTLDDYGAGIARWAKTELAK